MRRSSLPICYCRSPMGLDFEFVAGEGPVVHTPVRSLEQVQALRTDRTDELDMSRGQFKKCRRTFQGRRRTGTR
jgi:uroporphyrinogen decarboxylase